MVSIIIRLLRPQQWAKNAFIFLPLFFSGQMLNVSLLMRCLIAFVIYSFAASAIYCFNDIHDVEADRMHEKKRTRPVASEAISIRNAYVIMFACIVIALIVLFVFGGENRLKMFGLIAFYFIMNFVYCLKLKHFAIIDVMIIAVGFILRILFGGVVTGIFLTEWIILMTFFISLFLALAKRRDDVVKYNATGRLPRKNTIRYSLDFINIAMAIVASITIVSYVMYTVSAETINRFGSRYIYITVFFVLAGILRYLQISLVDTKSGSPTQILLHDYFIQLCIIGWIFTFVLIIYIL